MKRGGIGVTSNVVVSGALFDLDKALDGQRWMKHPERKGVWLFLSEKEEER
jgi:hypothetical protein